MIIIIYCILIFFSFSFFKNSSTHSTKETSKIVKGHDEEVFKYFGKF